MLFTEISDRGGIEVFSKYFLNAILQSTKNADMTILILNNISPPVVDISYAKKNNNLRFFCCGSKVKIFKKVKFVALLFWNIIFHRPRIIISNHINLLKLCGIIYPILRVNYGVITYGIEVWNLNFLKRIVLKNAKYIASFSKYTSSKISNQVETKGKIFLFPPCVDKGKFFPQKRDIKLVQKYNLNGNKVMLTVARLVKKEGYKGYDLVIKALPKVTKKIPNIKYLLIGEGDDLYRIKNLVNKLGLENKVIFCGFVPNKKLINYYNSCDVFIMPSKGEGFGIVFLEALACGKPVICGNKDGSRDAVLDGKLGILVDPDNIDQIAEAIMNVLQGNVPNHLLDPKYLRKTVLEHYGFDKFIERVKDLIKKLESCRS